ncbi:coiled-coil domain-containing protein [Planoprotostelium fungivorum]|uniref:Coiled-coil domain-containing protein n=1 Tax=Planoprotostelium fungivorum TaxID=1890364 RepID=A0A2P6NSY3_9EUKA|nr:coiled-coil domain-containing protein [Planoprotostelium fungivorum]
MEVDGDTGREENKENYVPFDEELKKHRKERIGIPPIAQEINEKLEEIAQLEPDMSSLDLTPKKTNFDLKRDVSKRLEKLERMTQRAIIDLMKEKLKSQESANSASADDDLGRKINMSIAEDIEDREE